jgi:hypothetical protein
MTRTAQWSLLIAALLAATAVAFAADGKTGQPTYKWVNEKGEVQYGDSVPPEYAQSERTVLNKQGVAVGKVGGRQNAQQAAEQSRREQDAQRRRQHDQFLLTTYTSPKDIERLRDERLGQIDGQIKAAEAYIETLDGRLGALQERAMRFKPYSQKSDARRMPDDLVEELVRAANEARDQRRALDGRIQDQTDVRAQFDADIVRYGELTAGERP